MVGPQGSPTSLTYRPVMIFIDGGYLREGLRELFGTDDIDFNRLAYSLIDLVRYGTMYGELRQVYYYDAIVDKRHQDYEKLDEYFKNIRNCAFHTVRLGRIKEGKEGRKQKGVDIRIAVDMLSKAFLGHYDVAIFLGGDDDFVDLISAVKDLSGKKIYGVFYPNHVSSDLLNSFDFRFELTKEYLVSSKIVKTS